MRGIRRGASPFRREARAFPARWRAAVETGSRDETYDGFSDRDAPREIAHYQQLLAFSDRTVQIEAMALLGTLQAARGRPREFDKDVVVERAMNVFWSHGYGGTSLPQLLEATDLSRGSLYAAFGDKHGLFLQALDRYIADAFVRIDEELSASRSAFGGLRTFLSGYVGRMSGAAGVRGCLVVATAMELAGHDEDVARRIHGFFTGAEARLLKALTRAETEGALKPGVKPEHVARILFSVVEGIRVLAKTGVDCLTWQSTLDALIDGFENK